MLQRATSGGRAVLFPRQLGGRVRGRLGDLPMPEYMPVCCLPAVPLWRSHRGAMPRRLAPGGWRTPPFPRLSDRLTQLEQSTTPRDRVERIGRAAIHDALVLRKAPPPQLRSAASEWALRGSNPALRRSGPPDTAGSVQNREASIRPLPSP